MVTIQTDKSSKGEKNAHLYRVAYKIRGNDVMLLIVL